MDTFGLATDERPRRTGALANFSGQPSLDRSGALSGSKSREIDLSFAFNGFPHTTEEGTHKGSPYGIFCVHLHKILRTAVRTTGILAVKGRDPKTA